jgi:hypothetical protein
MTKPNDGRRWEVMPGDPYIAALGWAATQETALASWGGWPGRIEAYGDMILYYIKSNGEKHDGNEAEVLTPAQVLNLGIELLENHLSEEDIIKARKNPRFVLDWYVKEFSPSIFGRAAVRGMGARLKKVFGL